MAYEWSTKNGWDMDFLLKNFNIPALFLQQTDDISTPFKTVKEALEKSGAKHYDVVELSGEDHKYKDMQEIRKYAEPFIKNF